MYNFTSPYNGVPTEVTMHHTDQLERELGTYLSQFNYILTTDVPAFDTAAQAAGVPTIFAGPTIEIKQ